jgi:hypothetical protein
MGCGHCERPWCLTVKKQARKGNLRQIFNDIEIQNAHRCNNLLWRHQTQETHSSNRRRCTVDGVVAQLVERLVRNQEFQPSLSATYECFA